VAFAVSNNTVLVSDGGLATELEARGHDLSDDLWSARLLFDEPQAIVAAHRASSRPVHRLLRRPATKLPSTVSRRAESLGVTPSG
jgi:hypothetical protein